MESQRKLPVPFWLQLWLAAVKNVSFRGGLRSFRRLDMPYCGRRVVGAGGSDCALLGDRYSSELWCYAAIC